MRFSLVERKDNGKLNFEQIEEGTDVISMIGDGKELNAFGTPEELSKVSAYCTQAGVSTMKREFKNKNKDLVEYLTINPNTGPSLTAWGFSS